MSDYICLCLPISNYLYTLMHMHIYSLTQGNNMCVNAHTLSQTRPRAHAPALLQHTSACAHKSACWLLLRWQDHFTRLCKYTIFRQRNCHEKRQRNSFLAPARRRLSSLRLESSMLKSTDFGECCIENEHSGIQNTLLCFAPLCLSWLFLGCRHRALETPEQYWFWNLEWTHWRQSNDC